MKVVLIAPRYGALGGVDYVVRNLAKRLASKGHIVTVVAGGSKAATAEVNGIFMRIWPVYAPGEAYYIPRRPRGFLDVLRAETRDSDVVHIHSVHAVLTVFALLALKDASAKIVVTPHYHGEGHTAFRNMLWKMWRRVVKKALSHADVIHTSSLHEAEAVRKDFGVEPVVIPHGVEEDLLREEWRPTDYVLWAGRIEKYKNVEKVVEVVAAMNKLGYDVELKILGDGPHKSAVEKKLRKVAIKHSISPPAPRKQYIKVVAEALFTINLSQKEAFGLTTLEAIAVGTPTVVAEKWGATFKTYPRVLLVDPAQPPQRLAAEIINFIETAAHMPRAKVETWSEVVNKYIKLYESP